MNVPLKTNAEILDDIRRVIEESRNWRPPQYVEIDQRYYDALKDRREYTGHEGLLRIFPTLRGGR